MKKLANLFVRGILLAASGAAPTPAIAEPATGQDFPGQTCICKECNMWHQDVVGKCRVVCKDKVVYAKRDEPYNYCKARKWNTTDPDRSNPGETPLQRPEPKDPYQP